MKINNEKKKQIWIHLGPLDPPLPPILKGFYLGALTPEKFGT